MTKGLHGCLWVFPENTWTQIQQKLTPKTLLDERGVKLERYFLGAACECTPDRQGRVPMSSILMNHAGIKTGDAISIIGLSDKVEIWSTSRWDEFNAGLTDDVIAELGRDA